MIFKTDEKKFNRSVGEETITVNGTSTTEDIKSSGNRYGVKRKD